MRRSAHQIHAWLHSSLGKDGSQTKYEPFSGPFSRTAANIPKPLTVKEISTRLGLTLSYVSNGLKEPQRSTLIKFNKRPDDRRGNFTSVHNMFELIIAFVKGRCEREFRANSESAASRCNITRPGPGPGRPISVIMNN